MTKARSKRAKHGQKALMARVTAHGIAAIDGRSVASRALMQWKSELVRDLGGETALSAQQLTIVELACRARLYLDSVDGWLMRQRTLVNRRHKSLLPVLRERMALADALARHLAALGLERREKPIPTLSEYLDSPEHEANLARAREEQAAYARECESAPEPSPDDSDAPASAAAPPINTRDEETQP
jgi:hypothetical protein